MSVPTLPMLVKGPLGIGVDSSCHGTVSLDFYRERHRQLFGIFWNMGTVPKRVNITMSGSRENECATIWEIREVLSPRFSVGPVGEKLNAIDAGLQNFPISKTISIT